MDRRDYWFDYKWWKQRGDKYFFEDEQVEVEFHICNICDGKGKYVNPSIDSQGIIAEEFNEDPDFKVNYMSGVYDVTCELCKGRNGIPWPVDVEIQKKVQNWCLEQGSYRSECEAERRMGC